MKYEKNQYTEGASICGFVIAGAFLWWGIESLMDRSWFGFIWLAIGISILSGEIAAISNRGKLREAVKNEFISNPSVNIEEISSKTGISKKDVQAIILDLKMSGQIQGSFSAETGNKVEIEIKHEEAPKIKFCAACGAELKENAIFCTYCGARVD